MSFNSKTMVRERASAANKEKTMLLADPSISDLQSINRELRAVKAERRRRKRDLYVLCQPRNVQKASSSTTKAAQCSLATDAPFTVSTSRDPAAGRVDICPTAMVEEALTPYLPETGVPPRLMRMGYMERSDGGLSPSPEHVMGNEVQSLDVSAWDLSTEETDELCRGNRCLSALIISARGPLDEQSLRGLCHIGPQLTSLEMSRCSEVSPQALRTVINDAAQLTHLDLSGCVRMGDEHIAQVASGCPSVTSLDLSSWLGLTDGGLAVAIRTGGFASLQRLNISKCSRVGDRGLREALDGCRGLKELCAGGCEGLTGRAFLDRKLAGGVATVPFRRLTQLNLENCGRLDPSAVEWIASGCTSLEDLVVSGCFPVTPEGVELLAATPPALSRLGVSRCKGIDVEALSLVAERGSNLQHLDISDIPAATAGLVAKFLQTCGRLESIDISGLPRVNSSSFRALRTRDNDNPHNFRDQPSIQSSTEPNKGEHLSSAFIGPRALIFVGGVKLPHLRVARMLRLPNLDNDSVISFAVNCPHLEEFFLSDSPMVTGACLVPLAFLCPLLKYLGLNRCGAASDETALAAALQGLSNLRHLDVAREHQGLFVPSVSSISSSDHVGNQLPSSGELAPFGGRSLSKTAKDRVGLLGLDGNAQAKGGTPVTGELLLAAASRCCSQLTSLGLEGHNRLTFAVDHAPPGAFPCLKELRLTACTAVDDAGLLVILDACPRVRSLSVAGSGISHTALAEASKQLSLVQVLPPPPPSISVVSSEGSKPMKGTQARGARPNHAQGDRSSRMFCPPSPRSSQTRVNTTSLAAVGLTNSAQMSAESRVGCKAATVWRGAVGLRPVMYCDLHLVRSAIISRFEDEDLAAKKIVRALRQFKNQRFRERSCAARRLNQAIRSYWFRTRKRHPDQISLANARTAANVIQRHIRAFHLRKRVRAAVGVHSIWKRYVARCMFLQQQRLRDGATGLQRLWRGYFVRTRLRVREKVTELQAAKRAIGVKCFKISATATARMVAQDSAAIEDNEWMQIRENIQQTKAVVQAELQWLRASKKAERTACTQEDEACTLQNMFSDLRGKNDGDGFKVKPRTILLGDGRTVHFVKPDELSPICSSTWAAAKESALVKNKRPRDPADFDVFRGAADDLWAGEDGSQGAKGQKELAKEKATVVSDDKPDFKSRLCELCRKRFARVSCEECRRGYCFRCSSHVHAKPERLGHELRPFQLSQKILSTGTCSWGAHSMEKGREIKANKAAATARSLPDCAQQAQGLLNNMALLNKKRTVEMDQERAKFEMKIRMEVEGANAQAKAATEAYNRASSIQHSAAKVIQIICHAYMERLTVRTEAKIQRRARAEEQQKKMENAAVRVQAAYRGYSVKIFVARGDGKASILKGTAEGSGSTPSIGKKTNSGAIVAPDPPLPSGKQDKIAPTAAAARVRRDCALRRRFEREGAIAEMLRLEAELNRLFSDDLRWAMEQQYKSLEENHGIVTTRHCNARLTWTHLQDEQGLLDSALSRDDPEQMRLAKEIKRQDIRLQHQSNLVEISKKELHWSGVFIRQHYKRHAAHLASKIRAEHTLTWLEEELHAVNEVVAFASKRLNGVADGVEQEFLRRWLTDQIAMAGRQRMMIDLEQEFFLEVETGRLTKAIAHASRSRRILEELLHAYDIGAHFMAERCGAELEVAAAGEGTEGEATWTFRVMRLMSKEETVKSEVQQPLQTNLEEDIASEETHLGELVKFTGDVADAPISQFVELKAFMVQPSPLPQHLSFHSWRKFYRLQPWLAAQIQEKNKRKAARASTLQDLVEMGTVLATAKGHEALAAQEVENLKNDISVIEGKIALHRSNVAGDDECTWMELQLKLAQEKLVGLEDRLERQMKANSQKKAELKLKQDGLEAEITAEDERHVRQIAAMTAFRAAERDDDLTMTQFGKDDANAAVNMMAMRLEKLKALQVELNKTLAEKQPKRPKNVGLLSSVIGFVGRKDGVEDVHETNDGATDYVQQAVLFSKRAELAAINREIDELEKAKKVVALDYASADAQMMLAEAVIKADEESDGEDTVDAKKLQKMVREAKQRAVDAKKEAQEKKRRIDQEKAEHQADEQKRKDEVIKAHHFAEKIGLATVGRTDGGIRGRMERLLGGIVGSETTYGGAFNNERDAVEAAIRTRHKTRLGMVEAVVGFAFTVGTGETSVMASKQVRNAAQGLPHFRKIAKGLGGGTQTVSLWVARGFDTQDFITDLRITSADPNSKSYKNLRPQRYVPVGHPKLAATGDRGKPSVLLWKRKDPNSDGITDVDLSYNEEDEKNLSDVGFKIVPGLLSDCGLPDIRLWYSTARHDARTLPSMKAVLHDLEEVRASRAKDPNNKALLDIEAKLESKLAQVREAEKRKAGESTSPLQDAIETYALTASDVDIFIYHFAAMDVERRGTINARMFFEYLEWLRNALADHLFTFMDSTDEDEDGQVDFANFVKLVCSYCMFGNMDLLKYAYKVYGGDKGFLSFGDLINLLNDIHKNNTGPIERALHAADLDNTCQLGFDDFLDLDRRFPKMFYPVANLQKEIQKKFLGEVFWTRKKNLFDEARDNIIEAAGRSRKARRRQQELMHLKTSSKRVLVATQKGAKMAVNRVREKLDKSKWMSKLFS